MLFDFVIGASIIALPQHQVPLAVGTAAVKATSALIRRSRRGKKPGVDAKPVGGRDGDDPAVVKAGGQVLLQWDGLTCTLRTKDGGTRVLLDGLCGEARPGRLLALMGPSGSGKTTLLNALAGQVPASARLELRGAVRANGLPQQDSRHQQAYVQQEDLFFSMLTVRETLTLAAELRLHATPQARAEAVAGHIQRLGLGKCSETVVGDAKTRGLSGGEKKRLQIACELVGSPMLVFADEPTTGLDSFQAERVMQALKALAADGHTVVASIHQPRSSIHELFDDVLLLADGREVYHGPARGMLPHFEALGYPCPAHYNPAEFASDLISTDYSSPEALASSRERVDSLVQSARSSNRRAYSQWADEAGRDASPRGAGVVPPKRGLLGQFRLLFGRAWKQVARDKANLVARASSTLSSAVVFGSIFWRMGRGQSTIQDRMGLLQVAAVATAMTSMIKTLNVFPTERTIVNRERAKQSYGLLPYILGKLGAELPVGALFPALFGAVVYPACGLHPSWRRFARFLGIVTAEAFTAQAMGLAVGAFAPSTDAALAIGPALMTVFIVFGGLYISPDNVPGPLKWLPSASLIKCSFEALAVNEFSGLDFEAGDPPVPGALREGDQVLQRFGFGNSSVGGGLARQGRLLMFNYWLTYCILKSKRPNFQRLLDSPDGNPAAAGANGAPALAEVAAVAKEAAANGKQAATAAAEELAGGEA